MNLRNVLKNMGAAAGAQGVSFATSILMSLLVPKVLGVTEFGYWQLFVFYFNYVGAFQLGLNDGVYLLKGGSSRANLDKSEVTSQLSFGLFFQSLMAVAVMVFAVISQQGPERTFVLVACAILMPLYNAACYFQYLLQAIDETRLYSKSIVVDRAVFMVALLALLCIRCQAFEWYVYAFCVGKLACLAYLLAHTRDILSRRLYPLSRAARCSLDSISVGIKLMFANLASSLILGVMRFVVDACWGIEVFGSVSLALSMANFFLTFVTQVTMVLFPTLRKMDKNDLASFFSRVQNALEVMLPGILLLYLPIRSILGWWLPAYESSFEYLGLILPLCLFDGKMSALYTTFFKVRRMEGTLFELNAITMFLSGACALVGAYVLHSVEFVLVSCSCAVMLRGIVSRRILSNDVLGHYEARWGEVILSAVFYLSFALLGDLSALGTYVLAYAAYLVVAKEQLYAFMRDVTKVFGTVLYRGPKA